jgi:hypothetical protein
MDLNWSSSEHCHLADQNSYVTPTGSCVKSKSKQGMQEELTELVMGETPGSIFSDAWQARLDSASTSLNDQLSNESDDSIILTTFTDLVESHSESPNKPTHRLKMRPIQVDEETYGVSTGFHRDKCVLSASFDTDEDASVSSAMTAKDDSTVLAENSRRTAFSPMDMSSSFAQERIHRSYSGIFLAKSSGLGRSISSVGSFDAITLPSLADVPNASSKSESSFCTMEAEKVTGCHKGPLLKPRPSRSGANLQLPPWKRPRNNSWSKYPTPTP